ncbi:MAG: putative bifunctional diguanylate cyclase/phosphodiesterase [Acidimicrobiales bacterium]
MTGARGDSADDPQAIGGRGELGDEVQLACFDQVNRSTRRGGLAAPFGAALLVVVFGHAVPPSGTIAWAVTVTMATAVAVGCADLYLRRRRRGAPVGRWIVGPCSAGLTGIAWASLPLFVYPPADRYDLRALYLIVVCGVSAANTVGAAACRSYFLPFQICLFVPIDLACLLSGNRPTQLLGLAIPIFLAVMIVLHEEVRTWALSELRLRERNDEANHQLRTLNAELGEIALRDDLTRSANRVAFVDALGRAATEAHRVGAAVGVVFLDLDRFKVVNDSLGHQAGDELLIQVAERIRGSLRNGDMLARLGGDEFTVLLSGIGGIAESVEVAERIHGSFSEAFTVARRQVMVTASIGVTVSTGAHEGPQDLLRQADLAQYQAKEDGRNRVERFIPALHATSRRRLDREEALRTALAEHQIVAHFQPQVDLRDGRIVGAEALARWHHPDRGVLSAAEFVPLAEESDLILDIDAAVRRSAVDARLALQHAGCGSGFRIWFNVSAHQLATADPVADLIADLSRARVDPEGIGVELTETAVMAHVDVAVRHIDAVRRAGIHVALDDFGTGHSSLSLLRSMAVDELKVDRSFVSGMASDPRDLAIVRAMTSLGRELGLVVVAEGVERLAQVAGLRHLHCDRAQGFLWSPAVPIDQLLSLVPEGFFGDKDLLPAT